MSFHDQTAAMYYRSACLLPSFLELFHNPPLDLTLCPSELVVFASYTGSMWCLCRYLHIVYGPINVDDKLQEMINLPRPQPPRLSNRSGSPGYRKRV